MKLLLDTAKINEISEYIQFNFIGGVTTNPSLLAKISFDNYKQDLRQIKDLCSKNNKDLSIEVFSETPNKIYEEAKIINKDYNFPGLHIKIPVDSKNLQIIQKLESEGIKINCTCVYTIEQSMILALMNVSIVSIFFNRTKDKGNDPVKIIENLKNFITKNNLKSKIIVGSIRYPKDVSDSLNAGADFVTLGTNIISDCVFHEGSKESINQFLTDLSNWQKK